MRNSEGPLPALVASAVAVCVIASIMGVWELWVPVIAAIVVVLTMCQPRR